MKRHRIFWSMMAICIGCLGLAAGLSAAQEAYPSRPIQVIVPFPPGVWRTLWHDLFLPLLKSF